MLKKALDTNILVYALLENHPASAVCDGFIKSGKYDFYATPLTPFEVYFVLRRVYNITKDKAASTVLALFDSPLRFTEIGAEDARIAMKRCIRHGLDSNDSLLIQACLRSGIPSLASDDRGLCKVSEAEGIQTQSPIEEKHRKSMQHWEEENLPPSGLPRFLKRVHDWLETVNPESAGQFLEATGKLRHLPR